MLSTLGSRLQVSALIFTRQLRTLCAPTSILPANPSQAAPDLRTRGYCRRCQLSHPLPYTASITEPLYCSHLDCKQDPPNCPLHTTILLLPFLPSSQLCRNLAFRAGRQILTVPARSIQILVCPGPQDQRWSHLPSYLAQWLLAHLLTHPSQIWP